MERKFFEDGAEIFISCPWCEADHRPEDAYAESPDEDLSFICRECDKTFYAKKHVYYTVEVD